MGHYHDCLLILVPQLEKETMDFFLSLGIKISGRLIGKKHSRSVYKGSGDRNPLLLSSGKL